MSGRDDVDEIVVSAIPGETRLALLKDGETVEIIVDRGQVQTGDVLLGRISAINRAADAAFVDIGEETAGFLPVHGRLNEGDRVLVQVTAGARRGKGAALTTAIVLQGRHWLYTVDQRRRTLPKPAALDEPTRVRLAALVEPLITLPAACTPLPSAGEADDDSLCDDVRQLQAQWDGLVAAITSASPPARLIAPSALQRARSDHAGITRLRVDDGASLAEARRLFAAAELENGVFESCGAADMLEQALEPRVDLPGGGQLIIEETAGCTVIDIDAGGRPAMEANETALMVIAAQIRLRGLAGHILVDVIPTKNRQAFTTLLERFRQRLNADPAPARLVGVTPLGSVELTRARTRPSLGEIMLRDRQTAFNEISVGLAGLRAVLHAVKARPTVSPTLVAAPAVIAALRRRPALLAAIADRLGRPLALSERPGLETYELAEERR
jgi:Rne/Rng family ribonuclease